MRWGSGPGGSRFLCGNLTLHEALEERLASFVGKKRAVVHATGFTTNLGAIACMLTPQDTIVCDRENHASIFEGCQASRARLIPFAHNDAAAAERKTDGGQPEECRRRQIADYRRRLQYVRGYGSSGRIGEIKRDLPDLLIYLDDAHGLGVMGQGGRGTVNHFGLSAQVDFIMGTFSKALASIGGFIAAMMRTCWSTCATIPDP